jgi:hypothetical protein
VQVIDDTGNVATQVVSITIAQANDAGTFGGTTSNTVTEDSVANTGTVTFSDAIDGFTSANFTIASGASNGTAAINTAGDWTYTPVSNYNGDDVFTVQVTDDDGNIETQVTSITVSLVDDTIVINTTGNTVVFTEGGNASGALFTASIDTIETGDNITQLILTLSNTEAGDTLSFAATDIDLNSGGATGPDARAHGFNYTVSNDNTDTVITIDHAGADDGSVNDLLNSVVFNNTSNTNLNQTPKTVTLISITDSGSGRTATAVAATVNTLNNTAPVATDNRFFIAQGSALRFDPSSALLADDYDEDLDGITLVSLSNALYGEITARGDGLFSYMPPPGFIGTDSFTLYHKRQ